MTENVHPIEAKQTASSERIVDVARRALTRVCEYEAASISIVIHLKNGGYENMEEFDT